MKTKTNFVLFLEIKYLHHRIWILMMDLVRQFHLAKKKFENVIRYKNTHTHASRHTG